MAAIKESCSVCSSEFEVQFRYQMEERDGGFSFYCSQRCLEKSQLKGVDRNDSQATCDACAKRFSPDLVSQVLYVGGTRRYACSMTCRQQLLREAKGVRLGEIAASASAEPKSQPQPVSSAPSSHAPRSSSKAPSQKAEAQPATSVPVVPSLKAKASSASEAASKSAAAQKPSAAAQPAPSATPRYLAVFNHKGGTGKTTTAVTIAAGLASRGKRVLIVDTDAQGNVSVSLGSNAERSLYHVLVMGLRVSDATQTVRPNLDLLPSNETLAAAELYLAGRQNRDRVLCERLSQAAAAYDFVVLDCSPSLSLMNQNALVFADSVLVPVACDYLSLVGVRQVIKTVKNVNALLHHPVQIWGVLPTFYDARAKIAREAITTLKSHFGDRCLPPIRSAIKVKEAPAQGQTIFEYASGTPAADDYGVIVDEIIKSREKSLKTKTAEPAAPVMTAAGA